MPDNDKPGLEKRISCPYCSEKILADAKKCRYCGEWVKDKLATNTNKSDSKSLNTYKIFFWLWLLTLIAFYVILYLGKGDFSSSGLLIGIFLGDILIGMLSFLGFITNIPANDSSKRNARSYLYYRLSALGLVIIFFAILLNISNIDAFNPVKTASIQTPSPTITSNCPSGFTSCFYSGLMHCVKADDCSAKIKSLNSSTKNQTTNKTTTGNANASTVMCVGPDGKQFQTTMDECKSFNDKWNHPLDYMVNCNIHADCGGGTKYIRKSECDKPCTSLKAATSNTTISNTTSNNSSKVPVFISYYGYTVYCPQQNVSAVQSINTSMENKKSEWNKLYNDCVEIENKTNPCIVACTDTMKSANWNCIQTYRDATSQEYGSCSNTVTTEYLACTKTCPNPYTTCQSVYSVRDNHMKQINELCK